MKTLVKGKIPGESCVWVHSQTLDQKGRTWRHGRAWLHLGRRVLGIEWNHGHRDKTFAVALAARHFEDLFQVSLRLPFLFSWWLWFEDGACYFDQERELSLRIFGGKLWWSLGMPVDTWHSSDPRWRRGSWSPIDALLGRETYSKTEITRGVITIEMPEGPYPAKYTMYDAEWKRARWPFAKRAHRFDIDMTTPIPEPGKGENSWDMQDSALESITMHCETLEEAIDSARASVLRRRKQYGGPNWKPAAEEGEA